MWTRVPLALCIGAALCAQTGDPMELLRTVQARVTSSLDRLPRYMCTETIDRSLYQPEVNHFGTECDEAPAPKASNLTTSDRLRMDVGMASGLEMYSWVGENRFDDRDLLDMVHEGAISNGTFSAFLAAIFRSEDASFTYNGDTARIGRTVSEFGFSIPLVKSHYFYGQGAGRVLTAYDGTFQVDGKTGDLVQLVVRTRQLPPQTSACYASTTLVYRHVSLGGSDFLLPNASLLRILHRDGRTSENRTVFSNCREFLGQSTISFNPPPYDPAGDGSRAQASRTLSIPPGVHFRVALAQAIDPADAAAGDPVKANLITPIKSESKVLVPAGASVIARIVRIRQFYGQPAALSLDIRLESVDVAGVSIPLAAAPDKGSSFPKSQSGTLQRHVELGTLLSLQDRSVSYTFRTNRRNFRIPGGLESSWVTRTPDSP